MMLIDVHQIGQQLTKVAQEAVFDIDNNTFDVYQVLDDEEEDECLTTGLTFKELALYASGLSYLPMPADVALTSV